MTGTEEQGPTALRGVRVLCGQLSRPDQEALLREVREVFAAAPPVHHVTRWGKAMSVGMASCGSFGWVSDRRGYRYEPRQADGRPWPAIPPTARRVWREVASEARAPECCLINWYGEKARMGLHQDRDEADFSQPVVSISLGDEARFRVGGTSREEPTESLWLASGDVCLLEGAARLAFHGIDRTRFASCDLIEGGGRINLTLRVVT